jgi:hypothetical protein
MDIFAVGLVLREMVTGREDNAAAAILPAALDRIVAKATAPRPEDRYPGCGRDGARARAVRRG